MNAVLGLDIGGANLKAAHQDGTARSVPFALWKNPGDLPQRLQQAIARMPPWDTIALTMTGELCDCFASKVIGVRAILEATRQLAGSRPIRVWTNASTFMDWPVAWDNPLPVAAANWRALATWVASADFSRLAGTRSWGTGLLLDIGSTTTDIIPWHNGRPVPQGLTDPERLRTGELIYTGVRRTPVCAILGLRRGTQHYAAEFFATTMDVFLVLGLLAADPGDRDTADGQPATPGAARVRLARMLCADAACCSTAEIVELAERILRLQMETIAAALGRVAHSLSQAPQAIVLAGSGEFLACRVATEATSLRAVEIFSLADALGDAISCCGAAYAVARLAAAEEEFVRNPTTS
jgi:probable H4MPT-linked C1 transfer pathway protein